MEKKFARELIEFIDNTPNSYYAVKNCSEILEKNSFIKLDNKKKFNVEKGKKYYIERANTTIIAFTIGTEFNIEDGVKIFASHTDSPGFKIKPKPEIISENLVRLNTEVYGGPILNTWFDRPLSISGRVIVKSNNVFEPEIFHVKIDESILIIPNLAIHQNREVNKGVEIDRQNDVLPVLSNINERFEANNYLLNIIANELKVDINEILDFDLLLYATEKGSLVGLNEEFVSVGRIDNLASVYTGLNGIIESNNTKGINVFVGFDHEEIGSSSKQGADSNYLSNILERIFYGLEYSRNDFLESLYNSFLISADGAHAVHPAYLHKSDPSNRVRLNEGIALKISANQKYVSDGYSIAIIKQLIENTGIKLQTFVNNSKEVGGSTIGPISSTHLDVECVDLGIPMLSMHSVREMCGVKDLYYFKQLVKKHFEN